jgi:hypothetical protein
MFVITRQLRRTNAASLYPAIENKKEKNFPPSFLLDIIIPNEEEKFPWLVEKL